MAPGMSSSPREWYARFVTIILMQFVRYIAGLPLVREKSEKFKVREKSGNFGIGQGNLTFSCLVRAIMPQCRELEQNVDVKTTVQTYDL